MAGLLLVINGPRLWQNNVKKRGPALTPHANPLTLRASATGGRAGSQPTVAANDIRVLGDALGQLGYNTDALLAEIGLRRAQLTDSDARLPVETYPALFSRALKQRFIPNLSLHLASVIPIGAYPLLDYLVLTCDSAGAGILQLVRYYRLTGSPIVMEVRENEDRIDVLYGGRTNPFSVEFGVSLCMLHLYEETEGQFEAEEIQFTHRPDDNGEFERVLRCPVRFNAGWNGIRVSRDKWNVELRRRDPVLRSFLERQADDVVRDLPDSGNVVTELLRLLESQVVRGDTGIEKTARKLGVSRRTLQRRLTSEGKSYQLLLDNARKTLAGRHVSECRLAICEVAFLLGYSEPAAFHRAFKRWYGTTPQSYRENWTR